IHVHKNIDDKLIFGSSVIEDEKRKEFINEIKKWMNFFKHADRKPDDTIEFMPGMTEGFLLAGVVGLFNLSVEATDTERAFFAWQTIHNPQFFADISRMSNDIFPADQIEHIRRIHKRDFFNSAMHFMSSNKRQATI